MPLKTKNSAFKANVASLMSKIVSVIGPLILVPIFVKYLTIEEYGIWLIVLSIMSFFYLTNVGILQVVTNAIAKDISMEKVDYYSQVASSGYYLFRKITLSVLLIAATIFAVISYFDPAIYNKGAVPLAIMLTAILVTYPLFVYRNVLRGLDQIHLEQMCEILLGSVTRYIATIIALLSGFKLIMLAVIYGIGHCFPSLGAKYVLKKLIPKFKISRANRSAEITKNMIRPSASFFILMVSGSLLSSTDNLVIGTFVGAESVPMYAIPMQLILLFLHTIGIVSITKMPLMSGLYKKGNFKELQSLYRTLLFFSSMIASIAIVNLIFFGEVIIVAWAGPEIFPGNDVFFLMLFFTFIFSLSWPSDAVLTASEKHAAYANMTVVEAILNVILTIYLTYKYGLIGAISGTVVSRLLTNAWFMFYQTLKTLEYKAKDFLMWTIKDILFPLILLSSIMFSINYFDISINYPLFVQIFIFNFLIFLILVFTSRKNVLKVINSVMNN